MRPRMFYAARLRLVGSSVGGIESLLDVSHTLLDLAFDLFCYALHLLIDIADRFANFLLYFAGDILDASFDLVLVHSISVGCGSLRKLKSAPAAQRAPCRFD